MYWYRLVLLLNDTATTNVYTYLHALSRLEGLPISSLSRAIPLVGSVAPPERLLADKAYDADSLRKWLAARLSQSRPTESRGRDQNGVSIVPNVISASRQTGMRTRSEEMSSQALAMLSYCRRDRKSTRLNSSN